MNSCFIKMFNITELTCRVCLQDRDTLINVYDELEDLNTSLSKLLETCADLQINRNDSFPKYLCDDCTRELLITSQFLEKCNKSKGILYELENTKVIEENEELSNSNDLIEYGTEDVNYMEDELIIHDPALEKESGEVINEIVQCDQNVLLHSSRKSIIEPLNGKDLHNQSEIKNLKQEATLCEEFSNQFDFHTDRPAKPEEKSVDVSGDNTYSMIIKSLSAKSKKTLSIYKCDVCGAIFKQAINLQKHLHKSHDLIHCYTCTKCDHCFSLETEYYKHLEECSYVDTKIKLAAEDKKSKVEKIADATVELVDSRKCLYCEREFPTPFALGMHLRTHTGERPFNCKYCTKSFKTQSQLNVHHKRHTGQADFICTICNKAFYEQSNLTVHMRSHTGERPHVCTVCKKTFTRVFLLQFHMRTHTGEKPFKCNYCHKSFRQITYLRNHLTIHTGQKKHICTICRKSYIKRSHLSQHIRKHHTYIPSPENGETVELEKEHSAVELNTAIDHIQTYVNNTEVLYNFDEIMESKDVVTDFR